tara:strand:- start:635 stop:2014 length:1380 start_codon:yes stop_codon:yes gene_type:complete
MKIKKIHFIGIGGIGMSSLAFFLSKKYHLSGSDVGSGPIINKLRKSGVNINIGHSAKNINNQDLVIYSSAINKSNIELVEAKKRKITSISRGEALAEFTKNKKNICVTGTHGKSTSTSFISQILINCGRDINAFLGAMDRKLKTNFIHGKSNINVIEADESDNSFNYLKPEISLITNIDYDHMDFYGSKEKLFKAFQSFINKTTKCVIINLDCKNIQKNLKTLNSKKITTFGYKNKKCDYYFTNNLPGTFELYHENKKIGEILTSIEGLYNHYNLIGAIIVCLKLGISFKKINKSINKILTPKRRFENIFKSKYFEIYDDYAHHPNAISSLREMLNKSKDLSKNYLIFQPHRYTRFKESYSDFVKEISQWENVIVTDVYSAHENKELKISSKEFVKQVLNKKKINIQYMNEFDKIIDKMYGIFKKNKNKTKLITVGAGDINQIGYRLKNKIKENKNYAR